MPRHLAVLVLVATLLSSVSTAARPPSPAPGLAGLTYRRTGSGLLVVLEKEQERQEYACSKAD